MSRMGPRRPAVRRAQRDEMADTPGAVQLLNIVPSDETALRVTDEIDALAAVFPSELLDPFGYDARQLLDRPCVEAAEQPPEVDVMRAVSELTETTRQPADGARCREEAMHQEDRSLPAVCRREDRRYRRSRIHRGCELSRATSVPVLDAHRAGETRSRGTGSDDGLAPLPTDRRIRKPAWPAADSQIERRALESNSSPYNPRWLA